MRLHVCTLISEKIPRGNDKTVKEFDLSARCDVCATQKSQPRISETTFDSIVTRRQQEYSPARDGYRWMHAAAGDQTGTPRREDGRAADPAKPPAWHMTSKRLENSDRKEAESGSFFNAKLCRVGLKVGKNACP